MNIIAIDCGASFIKGALIDGVSCKIIKEAYEDTPIELNKNLNHLEKTLYKVKQLFKSLSENIYDEITLCFSNEMHGFVVTDEEGKPFTDYISWQNECALESYSQDMTYLDRLRQVLNEDTIKRTGMPIKAGLPNVNLYYYIHSNIIPANKRVFFYTLGDYIIKQITGKEPYIHKTNAAATGIFDLVDNCWNKEIISKLGFDEIVFPEIGDASDLIMCSFMDKRVRICPAIGDQQAALLGADFTEAGSLSINFGTGAQVSCITESPELNTNYQTRPYFNNKFIKTVPHIPSGRALNVYIRFLKDILSKFGVTDINNEEVWKVIGETVREGNGNDLQVDLSFFTNAITDKQRGSIYDISEKNLTLGNLFDAIYEQMSKNVQISAARIANPESIHKIIFTGGVVCKNEILREKMLSKFLELEDFSVITKETFKGLAKYALGQYKYILFDLDGTLVNSEEGIVNSVKFSLGKLGYSDIDNLELTKFIGPPLKFSFINYCGMDEKTAEEAVKIYRDRYAVKGVYENSLYPGIKEMLIALKNRNKVLAVATSKPTVFSEKILENLEIKQYFDVIIGSDLKNSSGNKAEIIDSVINDLGNPDKQNVIMIGDRMYDIQGAKEVGIESVGVLFGFGDLDEIKNEEPGFIVKTPEDISNML